MAEKIPVENVALGKKDPPWMGEYKAGVFEIGSKSMHFRIYSPKTEEGVIYPLVLWLHGVKGRGSDNTKQISAGNSHAPCFFSGTLLQEQHPCFVLVPQCPSDKFWINFVNYRIRRPLKHVMALVEHLIGTEQIDTTRIYVGGQSMGAFATWALLGEYETFFAAAIPVSGAGSTRKAKKSIKAPVWIFHGAADPIVRVTKSREMAEALQKAGKTVQYTEFATGRHDIWPLVFEEPLISKWLYSNNTTPPKRKR